MSLSLTREQKQTLLWVGVAAGLCWLLLALGPILTPFIAAAILAYVLNPGVDRLARIRLARIFMPRPVAVTIMLMLSVGLLLALALIVIPVLQKELPLLQEKIPVLLTRFNDFIVPHLREIGIHVRLDGTGIKRLVTKQLSTSGDEIGRAVLASATVGGMALLGWLATLALVPVVLFYLLQDWHGVLKRLENAVPRRWLGKTVTMAREVDALLAQYLRGQLLVMLLLAIFYSAALSIAGLDVAVPVGIITGLLAFIPYLGFGFGLTLGMGAALLQFAGPQGVIAVAIVFGIGQLLEGFILTPYLVGDRIGLHPLVVIFALLAFGQLFGFAGVLLALPASAALSVAIRHLRLHYLNSSFYNS